jgi:hypothetical protein
MERYLPVLWGAGLRPLLRWLVQSAHHQADLVSLGALLLLAAGLVGRDSPFADGDWQLWTVVNIAALSLVRGRSLGLGPHPGLPTRGRSRTNRAIFGFAAPWWVWQAVQTMRLEAASLMPLLLLTLILLVTWSRQRAQERTAWAPNAPGAAVLVGLGLGVQFALLWAAAKADASLQLFFLSSACFLTVSLGLGDTRALAQRWASWKGFPLIGLGRHLLVALGFLILLPAAGLQVVHREMTGPGRAGYLPGDGFTWAGLATVYIVVWGAIAWKRPLPRGIACLLREVVPSAVGERSDERGFNDAPRGALAVEPLTVARRARFHPWYVTVESARARSVERLARPLWTRWETATGHALGHAQCAQDGIPGVLPLPQWDEVTIIPQARETRESWGESQAGVRREVILRPFVRALHPPLAALPPTFSWESARAQRLYQLNSGRPLRLAGGDVLVLSSAGIVRCFEFEPGAEIDLGHVPYVPQPEDYLPGGGS